MKTGHRILWLVVLGLALLMVACLCLAGLWFLRMGRSGEPSPMETLTASGPTVSPFASPTAEATLPPATPTEPTAVSGRWLLVTREGLWIYDPAGERAHPLAAALPPADLGREAFSLDAEGRYLAYLSGGLGGKGLRLVLLDMQTEEQKALLEVAQRDVPLQAWAQDSGYPGFAWSPQGDGVAFAAPGKKDTTDVFFYDLTTGQTRLLSRTEAYATALFWSPSGQALLYAEGTWPEGSVSSAAFQVQSLGLWHKDTGEVTALDGQGYRDLLGWLDEAHFLVGVQQEGQTALSILDVTTGQAQLLPEMTYAAASPVTQGAVLLAVQEGTLSPGVYLWRPEAAPKRLLTEKVWEFNALPGTPFAFFAYPQAVVTMKGQVYPAPRPELSFHPALSAQGVVAWAVADAYVNANFQVVVQGAAGTVPELQIDVAERPVLLWWAPDGRSLWWGTSSGEVLQLDLAGTAPRTITSLSAEPWAALWLP